MTKKQTLLDYEKRINRVVAYIYEHLDDELDMAVLAEVACFSQYHWHRIYRSLTGDSAMQTVRRLRLHRAAGELLYGQVSVDLIARKAGYSSVESFNRAFRMIYDMPPVTYRKESVEAYSYDPEQMEHTAMFNVTIETIKPMPIVALRHTGSYMEIGKAFEQLYIWASSQGLMNPEIRMVGLYYDDPNAVDDENLRSDAGLVLASDYILSDKRFQKIIIAGGRYAVLHHKGAYAELTKAYQWLYGNWLPQSGEQPADKPVFEEYLNNPKLLPPNELLTNIYLPISV